MNLQLLQEIEQQNPWLANKEFPILSMTNFHSRLQIPTLMLPEWDNLWTILIGPRQAGKTTLGKYLCQSLLHDNRFKELLYLNCDLFSIRDWLNSPVFISEAMKQFNLKKPIIFIDEVQRLPNPGLLLKTIIDLALPIKLIASGSSQLEMKSKVQEHLTGRNFSSLVLPLSFQEWNAKDHIETLLRFGAYPKVVDSTQKELLLGSLYQDYINKDIIEILKLSQPDIFQKLLTLLAHSSGQLVNYNQLSKDCQVSVSIIKHYLTIAQQTFIISMITPFVGNKRSEITSNPIFYFIDNGFRNCALGDFNLSPQRTDLGLLVQSIVFQEIYKYITQHFLNYGIHYWRTKSGAEVDFVVYKNDDNFIPIEAKYQNLSSFSISRSFRSFLQAYQPKKGVIITKNFIGTAQFENVEVHFIPLEKLDKLFLLFENLSF
jgi:predicted AAA+ superfamily ATPase